MNQLARASLLVLLLILLTACGTSSTGGDSGFRTGEIAGNSSGTLSGTQIGTGTASLANLRKAISFTLTDSHPDLHLDTAYLTRYSDGTEDPSLLLPVTNNGTRPLCFIKLTGVTYRQGDTPLTSGDAFTYVYGSVGRTGSGIYTNTCLDKGETGFFLDVSTEDALWSDVDNVHIETLAASDTEVSGHAGKLVPTGYSKDASGDVSTVTATNRGSVTLYPSFAIFFLLDDVGEPLEWSILLSPETDSLSPGSSAAWDALSIYYEGVASGLRVHFDYSLDPPSTSAASVQPLAGLSRAELLDVRQQRIQMLSDLPGTGD